MKRVHLRSTMYPASGFSVCRFGMTAAQEKALVLTTDRSQVTCKKCLAMLAKLEAT